MSAMHATLALCRGSRDTLKRLSKVSHSRYWDYLPCQHERGLDPLPCVKLEVYELLGIM